MSVNERVKRIAHRALHDNKETFTALAKIEKREEREIMQTVHVMVGTPASGRSSWVEDEVDRVGDNCGALVLSSDTIRASMGTPDHSKVFAEMGTRLKEALKQETKCNIYYDATNVNRKRRRSLYRNIKEWNSDAEVVIHFFSVPVLEAMKRNASREGIAKVPESVIARMHRSLQVPRLEVDCDRFMVHGVPIFNKVAKNVDNPSSVKRIFDDMDYHDPSRSKWISEIWASNTPHDCPPYHYEDVFTHIDMAIDNSKSKTMKRIALFHDLGKGMAKEKDETGYATYRGHADIGAHYYLNYLAFTGASADSREIPEIGLDVMECIHQHMNFHNSLGNKNIKNNRLNEVVIELGTEFALIDSKSKITEDRRKKRD